MIGEVVARELAPRVGPSSFAILTPHITPVCFSARGTLFLVAGREVLQLPSYSRSESRERGAGLGGLTRGQASVSLCPAAGAYCAKFNWQQPIHATSANAHSSRHEPDQSQRHLCKALDVSNSVSDCCHDFEHVPWFQWANINWPS